MPDPKKSLGKLVAVHGIAPAYLQRAVFIVVLSFVFFLAMMFIYYIRQSVGYFLLASAFLVVYLVTLFSWVMQRRNVVQIYENGVNYKGRSALWGEIEEVTGDGTISVTGGSSIVLPGAIHDREALLNIIHQGARKER